MAISLLRGWPGRGGSPLARVIYEALAFKTLSFEKQRMLLTKGTSKAWQAAGLAHGGQGWGHRPLPSKADPMAAPTWPVTEPARH